VHDARRAADEQIDEQIDVPRIGGGPATSTSEDAVRR
jgi:hypothetical protein